MNTAGQVVISRRMWALAKADMAGPRDSCGELAALLRVASPAQLSASSEFTQLVLMKFRRAAKTLGLWVALADNPRLRAHWWAGDGLDLVATCDDRYRAFHNFVDAIADRCRCEPDLLGALLDRLGTPGTFTSSRIPRFYGAQQPMLGDTSREWAELVGAVFFQTAGGWRLPNVEQGFVKSNAGMELDCWARLMRSYRPGLGSLYNKTRLSVGASPTVLTVHDLLATRRASKWPHLTSVALLLDAGLPSQDPAVSRLGAAMTGLLPGVVGQDAEQLLSTLLGQMPSGVLVEDAEGLMADLLASAVTAPKRRVTGPGRGR